MAGYEIKWSYDTRRYERNFSNYVEKPEKFRNSAGFETVTLRCQCDALINWAKKNNKKFIYSVRKMFLKINVHLQML